MQRIVEANNITGLAKNVANFIYGGDLKKFYWIFLSIIVLIFLKHSLIVRLVVSITIESFVIFNGEIFLL